MYGETDIRDIVLNQVKNSIIPTMVKLIRRRRMQIHPDEHMTDIYEQLDQDVTTLVAQEFYNKSVKDIVEMPIDGENCLEVRVKEHALILSKLLWKQDATFSECLWGTDTIWVTNADRTYLHINADEQIKVIGDKRGYIKASIK